jgi:hypothetical protein
MTHRQETLRLLRRATGILVELDGMPVTADGLLKQTILAPNISDHGTTIRGAFEVSSQLKRLLGLTQWLGSQFQLAVVIGLDVELKGRFCRWLLLFFISALSCDHGAFSFVCKQAKEYSSKIMRAPGRPSATLHFTTACVALGQFHWHFSR